MSWLEMFRAEAEKRNAESKAMLVDLRRLRKRLRNRKYRERHPEQTLAQNRKSCRKWRAKLGKAAYAAYQKAWRAAHPGKNAEYARRWREKHPERYAAWLEQRRQRAKQLKQNQQKTETQNPKGE